PREKPCVLEYGRPQIVVAVAAQPFPHEMLQLLPTGGGVGQDVIHSANRGKLLKGFRHFSSAVGRLAPFIHWLSMQGPPRLHSAGRHSSRQWPETPAQYARP